MDESTFKTHFSLFKKKKGLIIMIVVIRIMASKDAKHIHRKMQGEKTQKNINN